MEKKELHPIRLIINMKATYGLINEELADLIKDFRELAEHRGFEVIEEETPEF